MVVAPATLGSEPACRPFACVRSPFPRCHQSERPRVPHVGNRSLRRIRTRASIGSQPQGEHGSDPVDGPRLTSHVAVDQDRSHLHAAAGGCTGFRRRTRVGHFRLASVVPAEPTCRGVRRKDVHHLHRSTPADSRRYRSIPIESIFGELNCSERRVPDTQVTADPEVRAELAHVRVPAGPGPGRRPLAAPRAATGWPPIPGRVGSSSPTGTLPMRGAGTTVVTGAAAVTSPNRSTGGRIPSD